MSLVKKLYEIKLNQIQLDDGKKLAEAPNEIQLLRTGKFQDFFYGEFEVSKKNLKQMYDNYKNNVRKVDLAIDIAHMNYLDAAGWVKDLELKDEGNQLWATIEWTELGKDKVEKKLFRYLSAEFDTNYTDNEGGQKYGHVLLGAGLTNRPFVKGMKPTTNLTEEKIMEEKIKQLQESNVKLSDEIKTLNEKLESLTDNNKALLNEKKELTSKIEVMEKEKEFDKMLSEGKVVLAQKDAWIKGDLFEFAKNANHINLNEKGSGESKEESKEVKTEEDLNDEAVKLSEKEKIDISDAISRLLDKPEYKHLNN